MDTLIGIAVISLSLYFAVILYSSNTEVQGRISTAAQYNEYEHALRIGTAKFVQAWQGKLFETRKCGEAGDFFKAESANLAGGLMKYARTPTPQIVSAALGADWESRTGSTYREALKRCETSTLGTSGGSLSGRSTVYFCSLIESEARKAGIAAAKKKEKTLAFAEFRVNFWDFNRNVPLKCEEFKSLPGRGAIIQYSFYVIGTNGVEGGGGGHRLLPARRHSGRLYVPQS